MATALLNINNYYEARDNARVNGTSLLEEYKKLGGKVFEGSNAEVASYPKAEAIYDDEPVKPEESVKPVKDKRGPKLGKKGKKLGKKK